MPPQVSARLADEPPLLNLQAVDELSVVGNLHGSLESLKLALQACDATDRLAPGRALLFNGDFVDRGTESVEVSPKCPGCSPKCPGAGLAAAAQARAAGERVAAAR